jgi:hypothetical protein
MILNITALQARYTFRTEALKVLRNGFIPFLTSCDSLLTEAVHFLDFYEKSQEVLQNAPSIFHPDCLTPYPSSYLHQILAF